MFSPSSSGQPYRRLSALGAVVSPSSSGQPYRRLSALGAVVSPSSSVQPYHRGEWVDLLPAMEFFARINLDALTTSRTLGGIIVALSLLSSMLQK